jgi:hypothetical protein
MSNPSFARDEILELWEHLTPDEQAEIMSLFDQMPIWTPIAGVQTQAYLSKATITGYGGAAGGGKGLALDTLLATPIGFTTMADVVVGDTLLDETGNPCQVIGVSEISQRPCFELVFDDGTTVIADDVHRWAYQTYQTKRDTHFTIGDTQTLYLLVEKNGWRVWVVDYVTGEMRKRDIVGIKPVDSVPTKCIAVDSPSRQYLITKAMLPTHNTDLAVGLALTEHQRVMIVRDEAKQLKGITDRIIEIVGHRKGFNSVGGAWTNPVPNCLIDLLGIPNIGDETKMQGVPHDLIVFDETANLRESQVRFLMGWLRSADPKQRKRVLMTFNPPTTAEGRWVIDYFKPWLDKNYEPKAKSGELRACYVVEGKDYWLPTLNTDPFVLVDGEPCYDFDPCEYTAQDIIEPETRTFIHAKVTDNPYLVESGYIKTLQALPEPLRSQMLHGDFGAGVKDSEWQVIPTLWVEAAQARWKDRATMRQMGLLGEMDSLGVDPVRGGDDNLVIAKRYRNWIDELYVEKGTGVPDGTAVAARVVMEQKDQAPIHIDVIGVGASPYDKLKDIGVHVVGVDVRNASTETSSDGIMRFYNLRSQLWWQMREMLDPESGLDIALPPDTELLKDLTAPLWSFKGKEIQIEVKELTKKRIGRSPDRADAVILAMMNTQKRAKRKARNNRNVL